METLWEFFGLPRTNDSVGRFFGVPVGSAKSPFPYSRVLAGGRAGSARDLQSMFLRAISHPRFEQTDVFLTLDEDLVGLVRPHRTYRPRVRVLLPSETLQVASELGLFSRQDYSSYRSFGGGSCGRARITRLKVGLGSDALWSPRATTIRGRRRPAT